MDARFIKFFIISAILHSSIFTFIKVQEVVKEKNIRKIIAIEFKEEENSGTPHNRLPQMGY